MWLPIVALSALLCLSQAVPHRVSLSGNDQLPEGYPLFDAYPPGMQSYRA